MLVRAHYGGVDDEVLKIWIFYQSLENALPNALFGPSAKALEYTVPVPELFGQIAPRCTCASQPKHGIDEQAIVLTVPPSVAFLTRDKSLNAPPLRVRKLPPNQYRPPQLRS